MSSVPVPEPLTSSRAVDVVAALTGWFLVVAFFGMSTVQGGFFIDYHWPFNRVGPGEANFWLASLVLLAPAGILIGFGHRRHLGVALRIVQPRIDAMSRREQIVGLVFLGIVAAVIARLGHELVLLGYPITDDEWAARFGGEALAMGKILVRVPVLIDAFPTSFMFARGQELTSMDWLGTQLAWTLSTLTHTDGWVFAVSAALPVPAVAWLLTKRLSPTWGLAGALLLLSSPMALTLSFTTHGHLNSRAFLGLALALYVWATGEKSLRAGALTGLAVGLALICRPFETGALLAPLMLAETWSALREGGARRAALGAAALALSIPVLALLLHSHAVTGGWLPPRHSVGAVGVPTHELSLWVRFGSNSAYNLLRLAIFFAGPLGMVLATLGAMTDRFTRLLTLGLGMMLVLGLGHDNYGLHAVGPIHFSECVVPMTILAVQGAANLVRSAARLRLDPRLPASVILGGFLVANPVFAGVQAVALNAQAHLQADTYASIETAVPPEARPAVLLVEPFRRVWQHNPEFHNRGCWVNDWRRPRPDFSDEVLLLHDSPGVLASVRATFPTRPVFRFQPDGTAVRVPESAPAR